jgi:4-amino-4-deoxy-L-arabinose transferase-like glycosyltransferase
MNKSGFTSFLWHKSSIEIAAKPWHLLIIVLLFILLIPYPLFHNLDLLVLRQFDDARRGVNAFEMMQNGNLLVTHYDHQPDMWGTKPPLLVWFQTLLMLILGPGELAVRLPSAISGLLTCLAMFFFSLKYLKNPLFGLIWTTVLITFNGYVDYHGTRTGDFDAMLTFFMFLYSFFFFLFTEKKNKKYLLYSTLFVTLAVMTKGIAGLLFLPAMLLWAIISRSLKEVITSRQTWIGIFIFIIVAGGYYILREILNPGYLDAVTQNELGGRYLQSIEGHDQNIGEYIDVYINHRLLKWAIYIIPGLIAGFFLKEKMAKRLHMYSIILVVIHLVIILLSRTKLMWYDLPEYPFLALLIANFAWTVSLMLYRIYEYSGKRILLLLPVAFLILLFFEPIRITFREVNYNKESPWNQADNAIGEFLREGVRNKRNLDGYVLVHVGYDAQNLFYRHLLERQGQKVLCKNQDQLEAGEKVIVHQEEVKKYIVEHYQVDTIESLEFVKVFAIKP